MHQARLKKIVLQHTHVTMDEFGNIIDTKIDVNKIAEAVVMRCLSVVRKDPTLNGYQIENKLKKHFDIEE